jgi:hypothetical protein
MCKFFSTIHLLGNLLSHNPHVSFLHQLHVLCWSLFQLIHSPFSSSSPSIIDQDSWHQLSLVV